MLENSFQVSYTPNCTTQQSFLYKWKLDHTAMTGMFIATLTLIAKPMKHLQNPSLGDWINKLAVCLSIQWMRSSKRKWTTDSFNKTDEFVKKKKKTIYERIRHKRLHKVWFHLFEDRSLIAWVQSGSSLLIAKVPKVNIKSNGNILYPDQGDVDILVYICQNSLIENS